MKKISELSVISLIDSIEFIENETEELYLMLGKVFKLVQNTVKTSSLKAEADVATILSQYRAGYSAEKARERNQKYSVEATDYFKKAASHENQFLIGIEDGLGNLTKLDNHIAGIRTGSEEMQLVSINALTAALKSGSAGRAFSVITDELKRLSERTIKQADKLSETGKDLSDKLSELKNDIGILAKAQNSFFETAQAALVKCFGVLDNEVNESAKALNNIRLDAVKINQPINSIIEEIQLQDIIRQSLEHVRLALQAAQDSSKNNSSMVFEQDEKAFLRAIAELSIDLLEDVKTQVLSSQERLFSFIHAIKDIVRQVEQAQEELLSLRDKAELCENFESGTQDYFQIKEKTVADSNIFTESVKQLNGLFKGIEIILARFKNIVTASRIETARNKAISIVSNTVSSMMDLVERLETDINQAGAISRSFSQVLGNSLAYYMSDGTNSLSDIKERADKLSAEYNRIAESRSRLWQALSLFKPFSGSFSSAMTDAESCIPKLEALSVELESMQNSLKLYLKTIEAKSGNNTINEGELIIHNEKLRTIIERFTIFAHKEKAGRIASIKGFSEDTTINSGEVTLF